VQYFLIPSGDSRRPLSFGAARNLWRLGVLDINQQVVVAIVRALAGYLLARRHPLALART